MTLLITCLALLLDRILGEPKAGHPLVMFGQLADTFERAFNPAQDSNPQGNKSHKSHNAHLKRAAGVLGVSLLCLLPALMLGLVLHSGWLHPALLVAINILGLYFCLGCRSLTQHAQAIAEPLLAGDLNAARYAVGMIVSRDTSAMKAEDISKATVESILENANDACFATLFWFVIGGLPAALLHRLSNTLDAMWGYKTERFLNFGWAAARFDDVLNWIPARLGALAFALIGQTAKAFNCWRTQAHRYDSPNGGVIMAAGAGALGITIGGRAQYHGKEKDRVVLGDGRPVAIQDINRALNLFYQGIGLWLFAGLIVTLLFKLLCGGWL